MLQLKLWAKHSARDLQDSSSGLGKSKLQGLIMRAKTFAEHCWSILEKIIRLSNPNVLHLQEARNGIFLPAFEAPTKQSQKIRL